MGFSGRTAWRRASANPRSSNRSAPCGCAASIKLGFKNPKWIVAMEVTNTFPETYYGKQGFNWFSGI